jgi:hypothetical protein
MAICGTKVFVTRFFGSQSSRLGVCTQLYSALFSGRSRDNVDSRRKFSSSTNPKLRKQNKTKDSNEGHFSVFGVAAGASALFLGLLCYHRRKSQWTQWDLNFHFLPPLCKVHAATDDSGLPPSRRYNFIADVVEKIAPGVVYIEIKDR